MPVDLTWTTILQHLGNSLIPLLVVLAVGGGFGYLIAWIMGRWYLRHPGAQAFMLLVPWRSAAMLFAFMILNSALWAWNFFIPSSFIVNNNGLTLLVLFVPWLVHALLNARFPTRKWVQILGTVRTLSILSLVLPVFLQTEGLGHFIFMAAYWFEMAKVRMGYGVLGALMLIVDLLMGVIQFLMARTKKITIA